MMKDEQIKEMLVDLLNEIDYDLAKEYDPETAEEPEFAEEAMDTLVTIVREHLSRT